MTEERYFRLLEAYGADPARWPADEREAALAFAAAHPAQVRSAASDAMVLDELLDRLIETAPASDLLERRLLDRLPVPSLPRWMAPSAVAAALLVGALVGFAGGAFTGAPAAEDTLYADAFTGYESDWVDWLGEDA